MSQLLVTKKENVLYVALMDEFNRMIECHPFVLSTDEFPNNGNVYNGIVRKVVKGIGAYFIDIGHEKDGYLPMDLAKKKLSIGETVMVQVTKEPYSTKGAKLTSFITVSGENVVLITDTNKLHFSKKLPQDVKTTAIKRLFKEVAAEEYGFIVRTNAYNKSLDEINQDIHKVIEDYTTLLNIAEFRKAPKCIFQSEKPYIKTIKDVDKQDLKSILVDLNTIEEEIVEYLKSNNISNILVEKYENSLYNIFDLNKKIERACSRKIWLKSGASLIVERTEALTVIDVNSDKNIKSKNAAKNILNINLEAAQEAARIIRLRNISGIIIIDFIDMETKEDKIQLTETMIQKMDKDPTPSNVYGLTKLGLMEISRKRTKGTLCETLGLQL